jgi:uncharacterized protein involved in exopolysaccharide biosynthesis
MIMFPALPALLAGFLISYAFPTKYTSQSLVLVEAPRIPDSVVPQLFTEDLTQHIATIQQRVLSPSRLRPLVNRLGLADPSKDVDDVMSQIQVNTTIEPVITDVPQIGPAGKPTQNISSPAFYVNYTGPTARQAQQVCTDLTSMVLEEDLKSRQDATKGTAAFVAQEVAEAKQDLDDLEKKLAAFKNQHIGQLPGDEDANMKILMNYQEQMDANTQALNRASRDKMYTESLLAEDLAARQTSQSVNNREALQQRLIDLQAQFIDQQARHADDSPDGVKVRADIAQVKKQLDINNAGNKSDGANNKESGSEPREIGQLRLQIHQYQDLIAQATEDQRKFRQTIAVYQSRVASSPATEREYRELARDYDNAQKVYQDDLAKQSATKMATRAEQNQLGEQMVLLNPAALPDSPDFPNRLLFAVGGLGAGLAFGSGLALWLRIKSKLSLKQEEAYTSPVKIQA